MSFLGTQRDFVDAGVLLWGCLCVVMLNFVTLVVIGSIEVLEEERLMDEARLHIYTDGASKKNPDGGGWGVWGTEDGEEVLNMRGGELATTNNRMELTAVIKGLQATDKRTPITIYTDSQYVKNGITQWILKWMRNGWRTAAGKPVKNKDLWKILFASTQNRNIKWEWVRGHNGNKGNEMADSLANEGYYEMIDKLVDILEE